ncbi:ribonuclease R [Microscilla marina]|uniref:Ribonuclease R n=1 Tax=Microscilla marina ATCC 23134 TaxID=313606 RepID=A1ZEW1_MICM2|nr:ribonuclease R [Microscilla marina]EAY31063.1 ribonuclease R [Microscilla marina ATCC 23134]
MKTKKKNPKKKPTKKLLSKRRFKRSKKNTLTIEHFQSKIYTILNQKPERMLAIEDLIDMLNVTTEKNKVKVIDALEKLADSDQILVDQEGNVQVLLNIVEGIVDFVNPRFAFIVSDETEEDTWVDADNLQFALHGDRVKARLYPNSKGKRTEGEVMEVLERKTNEFVGKIEIKEKYAFVIADNRRMHMDIFVPLKNTNGANNGDKVIVEVLEWHNEKNSPVAKVKEVLGAPGVNETEMHAIMAEFGLARHFPAEVLKDAEKIRGRITKVEIKKRRDIRETLTFTIDPENAKDFDDALSIKKLDNGNWEIGIHIADVTHYVKPDSKVDKEGAERATSVYLVDRVVPMLPERLSNELCSLRPHEDKLTFSAMFELDENAHVIKEWFGRTVIHSDRRFSYEEAQEVMDSGNGDHVDELRTLNALAKKLTAQRFEKGAMSFETVEVKFKLDENGTPIGLYTKERKDAHKLIEEFMLLANRKVAEFVFKLPVKGTKAESNTMVYRTHDDPNVEKLKNFSGFAKKLGHEVKLNGKAMTRSLNKLMTDIEDTPQQNVLQGLAIRTMAKAIYTTEATGHFGLAFDHYTHFTSPIRRYPDMMVHRLLQHYLDHGKSVDKKVYEKLCKHSTDMEKRAAEAERASIKYKQVEYMQLLNDSDKAYDGVVTGVTDWGIYVEIEETKCEGMIRMSDLVDDFYQLDEENYRVVGKRTKNVIMFGDTIKVRIKATDLEKRTMDLLKVYDDES